MPKCVAHTITTTFCGRGDRTNPKCTLINRKNNNFIATLAVGLRTVMRESTLSPQSHTHVRAPALSSWASLYGTLISILLLLPLLPCHAPQFPPQFAFDSGSGSSSDTDADSVSQSLELFPCVAIVLYCPMANGGDAILYSL